MAERTRLKEACSSIIIVQNSLNYASTTTNVCQLMYEPTVAFSCDDVSPNTKVAKLKELLRITDRFDINATLFVIPKSEEKWNLCSSLAQSLRDAESRGHEIGLHGLSHFPFETEYPLDFFSLGYSSIKNKLVKARRILLDKLDTNPVGFRAPYHHCGQSLWKALNDLNFLYDSSQMTFQSILLSYVPPLRAISISRRRSAPVSKMFHPLSLRLWEIPITQEFTWYNLKFEVNRFERSLRSYVSNLRTGCLIINSHIGALSASGLRILQKLFLKAKDIRLSSLTLKEIALKASDEETAKPFYI